MKKRLYHIIIVITAIAISGIIITQYFWVRDALALKNEQFYQNAKLGLKRVVNQLMILQHDSATAARLLDLSDGQNFHENFIRSLDVELISRMIASEFENLELCRNYSFGIYPKNMEEFILINKPQDHDEILASAHAVEISCIFQDEQFMLAVYFPMEKPFIFSKMQLYIIFSAVLMVIVIGGFWLVARSFLRQKRLSEMKTDFVNNMTHELKTPISTISMTSEMLMKESIRKTPDRVLAYADIIYSENRRLQKQVDQVLQVAMLEKRDYKLKYSKFDIHDLIAQVSERFEISVSERGGRIMQRLNAANSILEADKSHLSGVIANLIDNANKYSTSTPEISISTHSNRKGIFISVEDRGIGMTEQDMKFVFKKFHRISTGDLHDVKGFGIGLYYVKSIISAHNGYINVKSKPGKGSTFILWLPCSNRENNNKTF